MSRLLTPRRVMAAPQSSALRAEQDRLLDEYLESPPEIVCEARTGILQLLARVGAADTILPLHSLAADVKIRCRAFAQTQNYYLLLVHHPGRNLPPSASDLSNLLNDTFETYFTNGEPALHR